MILIRDILFIIKFVLFSLSTLNFFSQPKLEFELDRKKISYICLAIFCDYIGPINTIQNKFISFFIAFRIFFLDNKF